MSLASGSIDTLSATWRETAMPPIVRAGSSDAAATTVGYCGAFLGLAPGGGDRRARAALRRGPLRLPGGTGGVSLPLSLALLTLVATLARESRGAARDP